MSACPRCDRVGLWTEQVGVTRETTTGTERRFRVYCICGWTGREHVKLEPPAPLTLTNGEDRP